MSKYSKPFNGNYKLTSRFGPRDLNGDGDTTDFAEHHDGWDFGTPTGTPLYAFEGGTVSIAPVIDNANPKSANLGLVVKTPDGNHWGYYHMSQVAVKRGQQIKTGQYVGKSGNTGFSFAPHLHWSIFGKTAFRNAVDPQQVWSQCGEPSSFNGSKPAPTVISTKPKKTKQQIHDENMANKLDNARKKLGQSPAWEKLDEADKGAFMGWGTDFEPNLAYLAGQLVNAKNKKPAVTTVTEQVPRELTEQEINNLPKVLELNRQLQAEKGKAKAQPVMQEMKQAVEPQPKIKDNSSQKQWYQSKKFLMGAVGIIITVVSNFSPMLASNLQPILTTIVVYIAGQSGVDAVASLKK